MQLTVWTYEGPPHIGAIRIAASMRGVHLVLHAPQGDTYADLLFTMIERRNTRPPVTYTTFQARDLGADTAEIFKTACREAVERFAPDVVLVGASCTAELIQDNPAGLAAALNLAIPVVSLELPSYQKKENWGAAETFYRLVRTFAPAPAGVAPLRAPGKVCNILGPASLGFRHRDDIVEVTKLVESLGLTINVVAPLGAGVDDLARIPAADFNIVLYPEIAGVAAEWLKRSHGQPFVALPPIGALATEAFVAAVGKAAGLDPAIIPAVRSRLPWYSRSVDSTYLTGKRVFIFGDATHAVAAAHVAAKELGFTVCGLGTYSREYAREVRAAAAEFGVEALISDDHMAVEEAIIAAQPELVLGTQMERHVAKRLRIPCAVISSPVHVQDFPARYSPQMGVEGANVLFDSWVHPLMMGLEEHLLGMFRDDFEFNDTANPSHLGPSAPVAEQARPEDQEPARPAPIEVPAALQWADEAERELRKIPFFVRGKARRNTEAFAAGNGVRTITLETLYDAKAHFSR